MSPDERQRLVVDHLPLARKLARSFSVMYGTLVEMQELESLARLEMLHQVGRFDPSRGLTFGAWVTWAIIDRLRRAVRSAARRARFEPHLAWAEGARDAIPDGGLLPDGSIGDGGEGMAPEDARRLFAALLKDVGREGALQLLRALAGDRQAIASVRRQAASLRERLAALQQAAAVAFPEPEAQITTSAAAELLGVSDRMVRKMVRTGRLAAAPGNAGQWRIYAWSVELAHSERRHPVRSTGAPEHRSPERAQRATGRRVMLQRQVRR